MSDNDVAFTSEKPRPVLAAILVALATAISYGVTLAWDTSYDVAPDGSQTGPYSNAQVLILVLLLVLIVGYAGWRGHPYVGAIVATVVLLCCWVPQAASSDSSGLWLAGALFLLFGASFGLSIVAVAGRILEELHDNRKHRAEDNPAQLSGR